MARGEGCCETHHGRPSVSALSDETDTTMDPALACEGHERSRRRDLASVRQEIEDQSAEIARLREGISAYRRSEGRMAKLAQRLQKELSERDQQVQELEVQLRAGQLGVATTELQVVPIERIAELEAAAHNLQAAVRAREARLGELEALADAQAVHIAELEESNTRAALAEREAELARCKEVVAAQATRIAQLELLLGESVMALPKVHATSLDALERSQTRVHMTDAGLAMPESPATASMAEHAVELEAQEARADMEVRAGATGNGCDGDLAVPMVHATSPDAPGERSQTRVHMTDVGRAMPESPATASTAEHAPEREVLVESVRVMPNVHATCPFGLQCSHEHEHERQHEQCQRRDAGTQCSEPAAGPDVGRELEEISSPAARGPSSSHSFSFEELRWAHWQWERVPRDGRARWMGLLR